MSNVILSLEVINPYGEPKETEALSRELAAMSNRLENDPDYSEEDEFLVHAFEGEYHSFDELALREWWQAQAVKFSKAYPNLVIALDVKTDNLDEDNYLIRREYYLDGKCQIVKPFLVVPDFDPEGAFE